MVPLSLGDLMEILKEGKGELVGWHDPDENREWILKNKSREMKDKRMNAKEAVRKFVKNGSLLANGGFGHIRVPMCLLYEIIRQKKRDLTLAAKTAVHDADILIAAGCVNKIEVAYAFGHELRGLSPASRRKVESGQCKVLAEISNGGYQWRFLAAMMGIPFVPCRVMAGTDTFEKSSAMLAKDPWSGKPIVLLPACYPDVALIHVHRCDKYGNAQIDGIKIEDVELACAARRVLITTEEIIDNEEIRKNPDKTVIPYYLVDAVIEERYGSHPCEMPFMYYFDEEHIGEWLRLSKTEEGVREYLEEYVYGVEDFKEYLELVGGRKKMKYLKEVESYKKLAEYPWSER